jgi:5'-methylthioadenosine phosphorylase
MSYATMALVTDYDCWHEEEADVSGTAVMEVVAQNVRMAQEALRGIVARVPVEEASPFRGILAHSLITEKSVVPTETLTALEPIIGRYMR